MKKDISAIMIALYYLAMVFVWGFLGILFTLLMLFGKWGSLSTVLIPVSFIMLVSFFMLRYATCIEKLVRKKSEELINSLVAEINE